MLMSRTTRKPVTERIGCQMKWRTKNKQKFFHVLPVKLTIANIFVITLRRTISI
jgi:hypothetical protein